MQTTFNRYPDLAQAGLLADNGGKDMVSRAAEGEIPFGRLASLGTDKDNQVKLPASATDITTVLNVMGVSVLDQHYVQNPALSAAGKADKEALDVLRKGRIFVQAEQAVTPSSDVYVRYAALGQISVLSFDADFVASNTIDLDINGVAITQVPFNGTHAQTIADLATEIQSNANVVSAVASAVNRTVTIIAADPAVDIAITNIVVAGGASQANGSFAESEEAKPATDKGKFRADADNTSAAQLANARYLSSVAKDGFAILEINL
jgi:hypothetical protein